MMDEQNVLGNVPSAPPEAKEPSLKDVYREPNAERVREESEEESEEETGETKGTRPRVSRLERLQQKKHELERHISALEAKEKQKERKGRTRRLIELGALSEKYFNRSGISPSDYEEFLKQVVAVAEVKNLLKRS